MGFIENLRLQSLFSPGIATPRRYVDDEPTESAWEKAKLRDLARQKLLRENTPNTPLESLEPINKPMNVVYKEPLTPFQRESLALRDRGLDINELRTRGNLDLGRDRINLQAERNKGFDERTAIQKQRADIYAFKAKNPNLRFDFSGPTVKIANPLTGDIQDTGIATGNLSDEDRINLGQTNALERLDITNEARSALERQRQANRLESQSHNAGLNLNRDRLNEQNDRGELPNQTKVRLANKAREVLNKYPWTSKHITFNGDTFTLNKGKLNDIEYQQLYDAIYGKEDKVDTKPIVKTDAPNTSTNPEEIKKNQAIEILKKNNKPVTEANIKFVMGRIK